MHGGQARLAHGDMMICMACPLPTHWSRCLAFRAAASESRKELFLPRSEEYGGGGREGKLDIGPYISMQQRFSRAHDRNDHVTNKFRE